VCQTVLCFVTRPSIAKLYTGWPKKVSYRSLSISSIKIDQFSQFFHKKKMWTKYDGLLFLGHPVAHTFCVYDIGLLRACKQNMTSAGTTVFHRLCVTEYYFFAGQTDCALWVSRHTRTRTHGTPAKNSRLQPSASSFSYM